MHTFQTPNCGTVTSWASQDNKEMCIRKIMTMTDKWMPEAGNTTISVFIVYALCKPGPDQDHFLHLHNIH